MDFVLSEMQKMLQTSARDFLKTNCPGKLVREMAKDKKGYPPELWAQMAEMGWMGLIIPEEYEGAGGTFQDLVILLEEMGRVCLLGPFFSSVVLGGVTLLEVASREQKKQYLPQLVQGKLILTLALTEESGRLSPDAILTRAAREGTEYIIQGKKLFVPDAQVSDYLICAAKTRISEDPKDSISLFLIDAQSPGLTINPLQTLAGDKQCEVILEGVKVPDQNILGEINKGWPILEKVLEKAVIARCAEMAGGTRQVLEMALDYAKQRKAFGHAIGSFQAIQHYFANMIVKADGGSLMVYQAAWLLDEHLPASREVAMTKVLLNEFFREIAAQCLQIHGAIGFTEDYDVQLYYKRAKAWENSLGSTTYHLDRISRDCVRL